MAEKSRSVRDIAERESGSDFWQGKTACWEMCHCPEVIRNECPAYKYRSFPCWEIEGTYCKLSVDGTSGKDTSICRACRVYKRWGGNKPIELKLFGKGIDNFRRYLEEKSEAVRSAPQWRQIPPVW
jgi:hypothetical protein